MTGRSRILSVNAALPAQFLLVVMGIAMIAVMPPARGEMVALSMTGSSRAAASLVNAGARIVRPGPVPGSLVINADRTKISGAALRHGVLLLSTALPGCGPQRSAAWGNSL